MNARRRNGWMTVSKLTILAVTLLLLPCSLFAQKYPTKSINLIISSQTAGSHDMSTRTLATPAEKTLGQPFVVINKAEGAGSVALGILARARADGYYIGSAQSYNFTLIPLLRKVTYKLEDFVPVITFAKIPMVIAVRTDSGWNTFKDLVDYAKKNPGKITYSLSGISSAYYVTMEYIRHKEGIEWAAMPYPSGNPYIPLLGKHVQVTASGPTVLPNVKSGELRVLAVINAKRWKALPEVPTLKELGYDFSEESLFSIVVPKATPPAIVSKLHDAFQGALNDPGFVKYVENMGMEVSYMDSASSMKFLRQEKDNHSHLIKLLKIQTEDANKP
jgi:tripartite-type tricarboxylate transporter receptor subunit TctC